MADCVQPCHIPEQIDVPLVTDAEPGARSVAEQLPLTDQPGGADNAKRCK